MFAAQENLPVHHADRVVTFGPRGPRLSWKYLVKHGDRDYRSRGGGERQGAGPDLGPHIDRV